LRNCVSLNELFIAVVLNLSVEEVKSTTTILLESRTKEILTQVN